MTINDNTDLSIFFSFQTALNNGASLSEALQDAIKLMQDYQLDDRTIASKVNQLTGG